MKNKTSHRVKGFTLIELLVVIAVLGILAAAVLVSVNPIEQLARGRDSGRKSAITQLSRAVQSYYVANAQYPALATTWMTPLVDNGDLKVKPANPIPSGYASPCHTPSLAPSASDYCYDVGTVGTSTEAVIYVAAESTTEKARCASTETSWITWASGAGKVGIACVTTAATRAGEPPLNTTTLK